MSAHHRPSTPELRLAGYHRQLGQRFLAFWAAVIFAVIVLTAVIARAEARDFPGEIVRIIDGDTIVVNVDLGFGIELRLQHLRIANINAPERGTVAGEESRKALIDVSGKKCIVHTTGTKERDQYGRILATVEVDGVDLGERQIAAGHAVKWTGKR